MLDVPALPSALPPRRDYTTPIPADGLAAPWLPSAELSILPAPTGSAQSCPFDATIGGTNGVDLTLRPGTINELLPSNIFSTLTLPANTSPYIRYLVLTATCADGQVTSAVLSVDSSAPGAPGVTMGSPPTSFKVLLAIIQTGVAYRTISCGSVSARAVEAFREDKASPTFGLSPYDIHYTWQVDA